MIVNIGSLNIDYVYDVESFVRKGQTISSTRRSVFAGGKGLNQSIALGRAGADVAHAGLVGDEGAFLRDLMLESGVDVSRVGTAEGHSNGHAIIQRDSEGDNCIILHGGSNRLIGAGLIDTTLLAFKPEDWVLLQNETSCVSNAIEGAHARGMKVVLNPSPVNDALLACPLELVDCFILNEGEAAAIAGIDGAADELLAAMLDRFPDAEIVLTVGADGAYYARKGGEPIFQPAFAVDAVDTTAAGDTFTGYYLAERAAGSDPTRALLVASAASSIAVSRPGAAPSIPLRREVEAKLAGLGLA